MASEGAAFQKTPEELLNELGKLSSHFKYHKPDKIEGKVHATKILVNVGRHSDISSELKQPQMLYGYENAGPTFHLLEALNILISQKHNAEARTLAAFFFGGIYFTREEQAEGRRWVDFYFPRLKEFKGEFDWLFCTQQTYSFHENVQIWPHFILIPTQAE